MEDLIKKIISEAVYSPSGDNHQPWRFEVTGEVIDVFNLPDRDRVLYNFDQLGSYIAHGCLLESLTIISNFYGYYSEFILFPDENNKDHTLRVKLVPSEKKESNLYSAIKKRATNRKKFQKDSLNEALKKEIFANEGCFPALLHLVENKEKQKEIGEIAAVNEEVLLSSDELYNSFFSQLVWKEEDEKNKKQGLYFKTLEIKGPPAVLFRLLSKPYWLQVFRKLGLPKLIAKQNSRLWSTGGAHGVISIPEITPKNLIMAGRLFQRVWLKVTANDFYLHPLCGVVFLATGIQRGKIQSFDKNTEVLLLESFKKLYRLFGLKENSDKIILMFRVGKATEPSARSSKMFPEIKINK